MKTKKFDVNSLQIASPCSMDWEKMSGDARKRFCSSCSLNVYNISELTSAEVGALIKKSEGRFCARMYRRADGTVITRDCPVGLRAYRKKVSRLAGAALATVLGLFSSGYGQSGGRQEIDWLTADTLNIQRILNKASENELMGSVYSNHGGVVEGARITFRDAKGKFVFMNVSGSDGNYGGRNFRPGIYTLEIVADGFKPQQIKGVKINARETARLEITLTSLLELTIMGGIRPMEIVMGDIALPTIEKPVPEPAAPPVQPKKP